tara:strand:+ start:493 stop:669 length:177 start_codon:yes stop_codon:yes gene_type:complete
MANKIKLELTERQLEALIDITDTIAGMIGTGSDFDLMEKEVILIDRMLKKNGYEREFD